jgi:hypothetical protein
LLTIILPSSSTAACFGQHDHVVGAGDGVHPDDAGDLADCGRDVASLTDLGLDEDVCLDHDSPSVAGARGTESKAFMSDSEPSGRRAGVV